MHLEIVTPEKKIFSDKAKSVLLPGIDGQFQILDKHAPIISALGKGTIVYETGAEQKTLTISSGFVECLGGNVVVLVEGH